MTAKINFGGQIPAGTTFTFKVNNILNAPSTVPSSVFTSIKA